MVDLTSIGVVSSSLKSAMDICGAMIGLRDGAKLQGKIIELQQAIIAAQQSALTAQAAQTEMAAEISELKTQMAGRVSSPCPHCGLQLKTINVTPDPEFAFAGFQRHEMVCGCGHTESRQVDPSKQR